MGTPKTPEQLAAQIKTLVDGYIHEVERSALDAVASAFSTTRHTQKGAARTKPSSAKRRRQQAPRRTPEMLAQLADELAAAIAEHPGESMTLFAAQLGVSIRALHRPMTMLKQDGRIRSVGERHWTRYFPTAGTRVST